MKRDAGFTLMELLVVLGLIAAAAAAVPVVSHSLLDRVRLSFGTRAVIARIRHAEFEALATGRPVSLRLATLQEAVSTAVRLDAADAGEAPGRLVLFPDGSAIAPSLLLISGHLHRAITVDALDGKVSADGI
jgi:prepilin-type N-terminal cleavage/methylation domain-containing protein